MQPEKKMCLERKKEIIYSCLFVLIVVGIYEYGIQKIYGFSILGDEFGYWANAAAAVGYDWSSCAYRTAYYSYGYGILLAIPLALCRTSLGAYRMAAAMNGAFLCGSFFMLQRILNCLFGRTEQEKRIFSLLVAAFYPVSLFYMQMTLTETLLLLLYTCVCYLLLRFLQEGKKTDLFLLAVVLAYMFFVHMRTIGTIMACCTVLCLRGIRKRECRRALLMGSMVFLVCFGLGMIWKQRFTDAVYGGADEALQAFNDIDGQVRKLVQLFSKEGILHLFFSCVGKLFYVGMASYGTVYFAIGYGIRHIRESFSQFLLLSLTGQLGVAAVFMLRPGRIDGVIYGRYNDFILPVFIGIGLLVMFACRHLSLKMLGCIALHGCMVPILADYAQRQKLELYKGYFAAGVSYTFMLTEGSKVSDIGLKFREAYLAGVLLSLLLLACVCAARRFREFSWILSVFVCVEIYGSIMLGGHYTYWFNDINLECMRVITYLEEQGRRKILYLDVDEYPYIDLVQFYLPEYEIEIVGAEEGLHNISLREGYLIVPAKSVHAEEMKERIEPVVESANLVLFVIDTQE